MSGRLPRIPPVSSKVPVEIRKPLDSIRNIADILPAYINALIDAKIKAIPITPSTAAKLIGKVPARSIDVNKLRVNRLYGDAAYIDFQKTIPEFIRSWIVATGGPWIGDTFGTSINKDGSLLFGNQAKTVGSPYMEGSIDGLVVSGAALTIGRVQGVGGTAYIDLDAAVPEFLKSSAGTYAAKINKDGSFLFGNQNQSAGTPYMTGTGAGLTISGKALTVGKIQGNGAAYIDLDSSAQFLKSSGVDIKHNGQFTLGNPAGNNVTYDGTNITLTGGKLVGGGYADPTGVSPTVVTIPVGGVGNLTASIVGKNNVANAGVLGESLLAGGIGVGGVASLAGGSGVRGYSQLGYGGVFQNNLNATTAYPALLGQSYGTGVGVQGAGSGTGIGVYGSSLSNYSGQFVGGLGVYCGGNMTITGSTTGQAANFTNTTLNGNTAITGSLYTTGAGRMTLNPINISTHQVNGSWAMKNKSMYVEETTGVVYAV